MGEIDLDPTWGDTTAAQQNSGFCKCQDRSLSAVYNSKDFKKSPGSLEVHWLRQKNKKDQGKQSVLKLSEKNHG